MKSRIINLSIFFGVVLLYPILKYLLRNYAFISKLPDLPFHGFIQVYCCFPILVIIGFFLRYNKYKKLGFVFIVTGIFWAIIMLNELLSY